MICFVKNVESYVDMYVNEMWRANMSFVSKNWKGILVCFCIAVPSWLLGQRFPIIDRKSVV